MNGKRGGFNALLPTMRAIDQSPDLLLQVVLTDMHLSKQFGHTLDYAKRFIDISKTVPLNQAGDTQIDRIHALSRGLAGIADAFNELKPDIVLLLGDRSETLIAAFAAVQLKIPVAHIQGGEVSGNLDEIHRHAITKLSHIHFTETELARRRVLELGEEIWRVHRVGAPYIDFINLRLYTPKEEVRKKFNMGSDENFILVLQHPVTTEPEKSNAHMKEILAAVKETGLKAIVVYPCSDPGYQGIIDAIEEEKNNPEISIYKNIPAEDFIGLQAAASVFVGNSSAGVYEAPYLKCPFVNVGRRQIKRERENNSIDVSPTKESIAAGIHKALHDESFRKSLETVSFVYGDGTAYRSIVNVLRKIPLGRRLFEKRLTYMSTRRRLYNRYIKRYVDLLRRLKPSRK